MEGGRAGEGLMIRASVLQRGEDASKCAKRRVEKWVVVTFMTLSGEVGGIHKAWRSGETIGVDVGAATRVSTMNLENAPQRERTFRRQHALYDRLLDLLFADKILGDI